MGAARCGDAGKTHSYLPEHWRPLTTLDGYSGGPDPGFVQVLEQSCLRQGVDLSALIESFAVYYQGNGASHGWQDPVIALAKTWQIEISKLQRGQSQAVKSPHERRIAQEKLTPIRPFREV